MENDFFVKVSQLEIPYLCLGYDFIIGIFEQDIEALLKLFYDPKTKYPDLIRSSLDWKMSELEDIKERRRDYKEQCDKYWENLINDIRELDF